MKKIALLLVITFAVLSAQLGVQALAAPRELVSDGDVNITSGTLRLDSIRAEGNIYIGEDCEVYVEGEIYSGGVLECFGGTVTAGSITARRVWLDSSASPLNVEVSGSVHAEYYTQSGGSVAIGGGLFCVMPSGGDGHAGISVNSEYARFGDTSLSVAGDIICAGGNGAIEFGGGTSAGGFDEAALTSYFRLRAAVKEADGNAYAIEPGRPFAALTVYAESITASRSLTVYEGAVTVRGAVSVRRDDGFIAVYGGTLTELKGE